MVKITFHNSSQKLTEILGKNTPQISPQKLTRNLGKKLKISSKVSKGTEEFSPETRIVPEYSTRRSLYLIKESSQESPKVIDLGLRLASNSAYQLD